jgi:hypothetical protein
MSKINGCIYGVLLVSLAPMVPSSIPFFEEKAPASLADNLHLTRSKNPVDKGWLANLTGLPDSEQVFNTQKFVNQIMQDKDQSCTMVDSRLKRLVFEHFLIYQQMANAQHIYFDAQIAYRWAHLLAMILKESSGDSSDITDMKGQSISTNGPLTNLKQWNTISDLTALSHIPLNTQTNFGLTQTSPDRLLDAFRLAKDDLSDTAFLEGREGAATPGKITLNTKIAIRRLIWFYQDMAQGRITEADDRIPEQDINKPEYAARYQAGLKKAILYCGTSYMFSEGYIHNGVDQTQKLVNAMGSIAYCRLGNSQAGYAVNVLEEQCYAKWVTLCPALNIDIASLTPMSYFATRNTKPVCQTIFNKLLLPAP